MENINADEYVYVKVNCMQLFLIAFLGLVVCAPNMVFSTIAPFFINWADESLFVAHHLP